MNLENQVCTFEQAKRLWELRISQESLFTWFSFRNESSPKDQWKLVHKVCEPTEMVDEYEERDYLKDLVWYSAFTVAELGLMLPPFFPSFVQDGGKHSHCRNERTDTFPLLGGSTEFDTTPAYVLNKELVPMQTGRNEAEARANMLIYLLEQSLISPEEVNKSLKN